MRHGEILLVEDEPDLSEALVDALQSQNYQVKAVYSGQSALLALKENAYSIIVSDVQMNEMDGIELLKEIKKVAWDTPVIIMTAFGSISQAVHALKLGASDYLTKPFEPNFLIEKIEKYKNKRQTKGFNPVLVDTNTLAVFEKAYQVAPKNVTILISGESGTGKEVLAQYIHQHSPRHQGPFIAINCAAIPENMLEAILFGYEKGAFTGAYNSCAGKFELANTGTLLLDEISEMPLSLQAKLLRVIQEKEVERLGGKKTIKLDVRLLATTNRNLKDEVKNGHFREDLYYRLNVIPFTLPPLRERQRDIIPLAQEFIKESGVGLAEKSTRIDDEAKNIMLTYHWPGNVRELQNVIQRAMILAHSNIIKAKDLNLEEESSDIQLESIEPSNTSSSASLNENLQHKEFDIILKVLKECYGNRKHAAEQLGISPRTLRYKLAKMKSIGIEVPVGL